MPSGLSVELASLASGGSRGRAASIVTRALSPDENASLYGEPPTQKEVADARSHVDRWKRLIGIRSGSGQAFLERLKALGLDEEQAYRRFLPRVPLQAAVTADWAVVLDEALEVSDETIRRALDLQGTPTADELALLGTAQSEQPLFPEFLAPFIAVYFRRIQPVEGGRLAPSALAQLARALGRRLSRLFARTAAYELKLARSRGDLAGSSPEERYTLFFAGKLGTPESRFALLEKYPVLARMLATVTAQMCEVTLEVAERLARDWDEIQSLVSGRSGAEFVTGCWTGLSDVHCGGRSAWALEFDNGSRIIYKPRGHGADVAYGQFIAWLNSRTGHIDVKAARVVAKPDYGWSEFIESAPCRSRDEVGRYYKRQGAHAAVVYFLCGQDFHGENFVAAGEYPVPIDLEGLLAPAIAAPSGDLAALPRAVQSLQFSVAGSLMLPYWRFGDLDHLLFETSGIGGSGQRPWPVKQPYWTGLNTDEFALSYHFEEFTFDDSVPRLDGAKVPVTDFLPQVQEGFAEVYRTVLRHRDEVLSSQSILAAFREIENRLLFRDTQDYANLLFWTTAPDLLESGAAHDVALEVLAGGLAVFPNGTSYPAIVEEEKDSLWRRDVPIAYGRPSSTNIFFPSGREFGPIIPSDVFDQMRQRFSEACEADLEWQKSLIGAMFQMANDGPRTAGAVSAEAHDGGQDKERRIMARAVAIAEELERTAVRLEEGANWLSLGRLSGGAGRVYPLQNDPWSLRGAAGAALFLSNMARATGNESYGALAREGLRCASTTLDQIAKGPFAPRLSASAYLGSFGVVYALAASGVQLGDDQQKQEAVRIALGHERDWLVRGQNPDFLSGAAGTIAVLSYLHELTGEPRLLDLARYMAVEVIGKCAVEGGRRGWQVPGFPRPLLGMAHGSAGISAALLLLYRSTRDSMFLEWARAGMLHERDHFQPGDRQWPNLQEDPGRISFMTGWCAGAPGVGLSRLIANDVLGPQADTDLEIEDAIRATERHMDGYAQHLCCGESGRIAFLERASQALGREELHRQAIEGAAAMVDKFDRQGFWRLQEFSERIVLPDLLGGAIGAGLTLLSVVRTGCSEVLTLT